MCKILVVSGVGVLSTAVWMMTLGCGAGACDGAELILPRKPRSPHDSDQTPRGPFWAYFFCQAARDSTVLLSRATGTRSRRPEHVYWRRDPGRRRTYDRWSSGDPGQPPTRARRGTHRPGRALEPKGHRAGRRRIGPRGRGDGAAGSQREPHGGASTGCHRPGSAATWMVRPRAARTRTPGKSRMVKQGFPNRSSGDQFAFPV